MLENYELDKITPEDIDYWGRNSRRKITEHDSIEHQELDKKYGSSHFYRRILPGYTIDEYELDSLT